MLMLKWRGYLIHRGTVMFGIKMAIFEAIAVLIMCYLVISSGEIWSVGSFLTGTSVFILTSVWITTRKAWKKMMEYKEEMFLVRLEPTRRIGEFSGF
jgi:hypothetical protein